MTWSLNSIRLTPPFNSPILSLPATTPLILLPPVILLPARKKLPKTSYNLGVRNFYTHTMIANR